MRSRALWLEELYFLDGRDLASHPMKGTFTGLAKQVRLAGVN